MPFFGSKSSQLHVQVDGHSTINIDGKSMPVFYSTLENPAVIEATITLQVDKECAGDAVDIFFKAGATYKYPAREEHATFLELDDFFQRKRWDLDLNRPKEGRVASGIYKQKIATTIDPLWASSGRTSAHMKGSGWIKYTVEALFRKTSMGANSVIVSQAVEVWVLNSTLPLNYGRDPRLVHEIQGLWKDDTLPVALVVPEGNVIQMGQVAPLTVKIGAFRDQFVGQAVVVSKVVLTLRQVVKGRNGVRAVVELEMTKDMLTLPIRDGWPCSVEPWERTINLSIPSSPELTPTTRSKFLDISYFVILSMKVRAEGEREFKAHQYELPVEVQVVVPRMFDGMKVATDEPLPAYNNQSVGHQAQLPTTEKYHEVKA